MRLPATRSPAGFLIDALDQPPSRWATRSCRCRERQRTRLKRYEDRENAGAAAVAGLLREQGHESSRSAAPKPHSRYRVHFRRTGRPTRKYPLRDGRGTADCWTCTCVGVDRPARGAMLRHKEARHLSALTGSGIRVELPRNPPAVMSRRWSALKVLIALRRRVIRFVTAPTLLPKRGLPSGSRARKTHSLSRSLTHKGFSGSAGRAQSPQPPKIIPYPGRFPGLGSPPACNDGRRDARKD